MSEKVEIRSEDTVDKDFFSSLEEFYSDLDDSWSRFVPKQFQSSDYNPNTLTVTESVIGDAVVNVSCYKHVDSSKFFLRVIASLTSGGNVEIEAFLSEVPDMGVVEIQYGTYGRPERRIITEEEVVDSDGKQVSDVVSETTEMMSNLCEELDSKSVEELILESQY